MFEGGSRGEFGQLDQVHRRKHRRSQSNIVASDTDEEVIVLRDVGSNKRVVFQGAYLWRDEKNL